MKTMDVNVKEASERWPVKIAFANAAVSNASSYAFQWNAALVVVPVRN
jgi:hypothetical protein